MLETLNLGIVQVAVPTIVLNVFFSAATYYLLVKNKEAILQNFGNNKPASFSQEILSGIGMLSGVVSIIGGVLWFAMAIFPLTVVFYVTLVAVRVVKGIILSAARYIASPQKTPRSIIPERQLAPSPIRSEVRSVPELVGNGRSELRSESFEKLVGKTVSGLTSSIPTPANLQTGEFILRTPRTLAAVRNYALRSELRLSTVFVIAGQAGQTLPLVSLMLPYSALSLGKRGRDQENQGLLKILERKSGLSLTPEAGLKRLSGNAEAQQLWEALPSISVDNPVAPVVIVQNADQKKLHEAFEIILTGLYRAKQGAFVPAVVTPDDAVTRDVKAECKRFLVVEAGDSAVSYEGRLLIGSSHFVSSRVQHHRVSVISLNPGDAVPLVTLSLESFEAVNGYETSDGTKFNAVGAVLSQALLHRLDPEASQLRQRTVDQMLAFENLAAVGTAQRLASELRAARLIMIMA